MQKYITPARVCGFAGMNPSPIPAKKLSSVPSVVSKERKRLGERKKAFNTLFLAEHAEKDKKYCRQK